MEKYTTGIDMKQFEHINRLSCYNHNYYFGFDGDLLLGESDDDNTTEWFLLKGINFVPIGYSYTSEGDIFEPIKQR